MIPIPYSLFICLFAMVGCFTFSRRSIGAGMAALMTVGYAYGILRANLADGFSHFIFDAGLAGFYAARFTTPETPAVLRRSGDALNWLCFLIGWPVFLFLLPINNILVQLVGLRHIVFFLPMLLIGARARERDLDRVATALAWLNCIAFVFTVLEYQYGIQPFFPRSPVTDIMYRSHDIRTTEGTFHRIPATFSSAHSYGGALLMSLPFLLNQIVNPTKSARYRLAMSAASVISMLGMFMAGPRLPLVQLFCSLAVLLVLPGLNFGERFRLGWKVAAILAITVVYAASDSRMQRVTSLTDSKMVEERAAGSLNYSLSESLREYPIGVGLGGASGSSMPYFLQSVAPVQIGAENEYARIAVEQGVVGFLLWTAFVLRLVLKRPRPLTARWRIGLYGVWAVTIVSWGTAWIGLGMMQSIPASIVLLFSFGMLLRRSPEWESAPAPERIHKPVVSTPVSNAIPIRPDVLSKV